MSSYCILVICSSCCLQRRPCQQTGPRGCFLYAACPPRLVLTFYGQCFPEPRRLSSHEARDSRNKDKTGNDHLLHYRHTTTVLQPFFRDHPGEPVPEENFWTLWCKGRLTEADTQTIWLGATPSGLTSAHLHHRHFFTGQMPFLPPNQQCQSTETSPLTVCLKQTCHLTLFLLAMIRY